MGTSELGQSVVDGLVLGFFVDQLGAAHLRI